MEIVFIILGIVLVAYAIIFFNNLKYMNIFDIFINLCIYAGILSLLFFCTQRFKILDKESEYIKYTMKYNISTNQYKADKYICYDRVYGIDDKCTIISSKFINHKKMQYIYNK